MADDPLAADVAPLVYDELRKLAARYLQSERPSISLQPTDLVHGESRLVPGLGLEPR